MQQCDEMTDAISQRIKKKVYVLAWHSLSQQGQSPTDKDTLKDFHKLVSTINFLLGWEGCHLLDFASLEEQQKVQTCDKDQSISKNRNFGPFAEDSYPYPSSSLQESVLSKHIKAKIFPLVCLQR